MKDSEKLEVIVRVVCDYYEITPEELKSKSRLRQLADARKVYAFLSRKITHLSLMQIGDVIFRDHATILYARQGAENLIQYDGLGKHVTEIEERVNRIVNNEDHYAQFIEFEKWVASMGGL